MHFDYYRNFISIVETGTLTGAAKKLNMAQPALSAQLKIIEQDYGVKLLRTHKGIRKLELTEAGKVFYEKAKQLCDLEGLTRLEVQNVGNGVSGLLKLSISPARTPFFIQRYIKPFCKLYPEVSYQIQEVDVHTQMQHILDNTSDIAIANAPLPAPNMFTIVDSQKERFIVVISNDDTSPVFAMHKIRLQDLAGQLLCTNFGSYQLLQTLFKKYKITARFILVATTRTVALQFVEQNIGIAIIPAENGEILSDTLKEMPIEEEQLFLTKTIFTAKNKMLSAAAESFLNFYQQEKARMLECDNRH